MKKKNRIIILIILLMTGCIGLLLFKGRYRLYDTAEAYTADGGRLPYEIPAEASDCRFLLRNVTVGRTYLYAFTLPNDAAQNYIAELVKTYRLDSTAENDVQYGYAHWYGKTAAECAETENELDAFPLHLPFARITDRDIAAAAVLVFSPAGTGSRTEGILYFEDTNEFVCFQHLAMK